MTIGHGLTLMAIVFFAVWLAFFFVSESIIRRDARAGAHKDAIDPHENARASRNEEDGS